MPCRMLKADLESRGLCALPGQELKVAEPHYQDPVNTLPPMNRKRVFGLAVPIIGEQVLHTMVVAVDTLLVARLSK